MFKKMTILICASILVATVHGWAGEKASQEIVDMANSELVQVGEDPVIVAAVKKSNARRMSLADIKKHDDKWKKSAGISDFMKPILESACAKHLRSIQNSKSYIDEAFVMNNKGANVAMTDKTSDFWQGDEAKFKKSFNGGKGGVFIDDVEFDDSAQAYLVQVSVPVKDEGKVIGAITFGINVDKFEQK